MTEKGGEPVDQHIIRITLGPSMWERKSVGQQN